MKEDGRYTYIASGSLLGVTLRQTTSVPAGSVIIKHMYQLDFEEFLWANGFTEEAVSVLEQKFLQRESLDESMHGRMMDLFKKYLLVGGLPDAVNEYLSSRNIVAVRDIHEAIHTLYGIDASQYDEKRLSNHGFVFQVRKINSFFPEQWEIMSIVTPFDKFSLGL